MGPDLPPQLALAASSTGVGTQVPSALPVLPRSSGPGWLDPGGLTRAAQPAGQEGLIWQHLVHCEVQTRNIHVIQCSKPGLNPTSGF